MCRSTHFFNRRFSYIRVLGWRKVGLHSGRAAFWCAHPGYTNSFVRGKQNLPPLQKGWRLSVKSHAWIPSAYRCARHFLNSSLGKSSSVSSDYKRALVLFFVIPSEWKCLCDRWWLSTAAACFCNIVAVASISTPLWNNAICLSLTGWTCWSWASELVTTVALTPFISRSREHTVIRERWATFVNNVPRAECVRFDCLGLFIKEKPSASDKNMPPLGFAIFAALAGQYKCALQRTVTWQRAMRL